MQKHIKNYYNYHGYAPDEFIPCEVCGKQAVDIHHIVYKSAMGSDNIENLIGLCRDCHQQSHFLKEPFLTKKELLKYKKV